jgi:hypothetical protein
MRQHELTPDERQAYESHLAQCAACRDDAADPMGRALVQTTIEMALPPPDFTARLLQRLPQESPLQLAQQDVQRHQRRWTIGVGLALAVLALAAVVGVSFQTAWTGTALGLAAEAVQVVVGDALATIGAMIVGAGVLAALLQRVLRQSRTGFALGSAALACAVLMLVGVTAQVSDRSADATSAALATVFRPIRTQQPVSGDVVSLLGDIVVDSPVDGNVASVLGRVTVEPGARVAGDVFAGAGAIQAAAGAIGGRQLAGPGSAALGAVLKSSGAQSFSAVTVRTLAGLLGALVTLALSALVVMLWPQRTLQTSRVLPRRPWLALSIGVLITGLLALLALPLLALLALTVVGLLAVPLLLMLVHLPYIQGLAAVGQALGRRLTGTVTVGSALWGIAAQLVLVTLLGIFAPLAGLVAFYLLASLGLGAQLLERQALI